MKTDAGNADNSTVFAWAHDALVRIYNDAGNVIETHEHKGDLRSGDTFFLKLAICVFKEGQSASKADNDKEKSGRKSAATQLTEFANTFAFFHDPQDRPFVPVRL